QQVTTWILQDRCRMIYLLGMGGIGKSALAIQIMYLLADHFDIVLFRSLRNKPSCEEFLTDCLQVLLAQSTMPASFEQRKQVFLERFRSCRVLLVLDNIESLLEEGNSKGYLQPEFLDYRQIFRPLTETGHQSCIILSSRLDSRGLRPYTGKHAPIR